MIEFSPEAIHAETHALLLEALQYLNRLPTVPTTTALVKKIEAHLVDPKAAATLRQTTEANELERKKKFAQATVFAPSGAPWIKATVSPAGIKLRITSKPGAQKRVAELLKEGCFIAFSENVDQKEVSNPEPAVTATAESDLLAVELPEGLLPVPLLPLLPVHVSALPEEAARDEST